MEPPDITVLYGSQTGNAEDLAKRIGLQAKKLNFRIKVMVMDEFALKELPKQMLVIFVCSTTGHGQEPENMKNLFNFMRRRDLPADCLNQLKFVVVGLGDSSYVKFNYVSKILFKRLKECGGRPLEELIIGDEQHAFGCDGAIYPKLEGLWARLKASALNGDEKQSNIWVDSSSYEVQYLEDNSDDKAAIFSDRFYAQYDIKTAMCIDNRRLTSQSHFQDTRHLRFKSLDPIDFEPGDVCTIYPANCDSNVREFIDLLQLDPNKRIKLMKRDRNFMINYLYDYIPDGIRIVDLVKYYLDIQSVPKRSFFEYLWPFGDNQLERDKLKEFASTEGQEDVYDYCIQPKRSILEVLADFPNTIKNIKFDYIFDLVPPIKPRSFSIASSCLMYPNEIHLLVGVVEYRTRMKKLRRGLCSNYLANMRIVDKPNCDMEAARSLDDRSILRFFIRRSAFKLPHSDSHPIVMIGPGLGLAPFRSFIQHRAIRRQAGAKTKETGCLPDVAPNHLYFGCRYGDKDFYFKDELEDYDKKSLLRLRRVFSRDMVDGGHAEGHTPRYVQDLLTQDELLISELIKDYGANIYIAGNSKLPEELRRLLGRMLFNETGGPSTDGQASESDQEERLVSWLEAEGRIQYDCW